MVGDVLLSCSMSTFHQQLSMYNNQVPREQCVAEIVSDHVDHTLPEGCYGSSLNCPRAVGFETEGTKVRDDTTLTAETPPCAENETVTDSFYICNKYI